MLEAHTSCSAREFLNTEVLQAYGMSRSTFNKASSDMKDLARGCSKSPCLYDVWYTNVKFAGGLLAHPEDYAHILTLVANNGKDEKGNQVIPWDDLVNVMTPAYHKDSSLKACKVDGDCNGAEVCITNRCLDPIKAGGQWYGLGVGLGDNDRYEGFPAFLSHGGSHPGFRTHFEINRRTKTGIVVMINGDGEWNKGGIKYGGEALMTDILRAFNRAY